MRVIPVIDLLRGAVVRGIAGRRAEYRPISSTVATSSEPSAVAAALASTFGFRTAYVADLDAIQLGQPDVEAWKAIAAAGLELILDAGTGSCVAAASVLEQTQTASLNVRLVVGLESLRSADELAALGKRFDSLIFSVDLRAGQLVTQLPELHSLDPLDLVEKASGCGIKEFILLDLADVGTGGGTRTLELCREIRRSRPQLSIITGGGVRGAADLAALADAGCDAALVASALHDGRLTPTDLENYRS